MIAPRQSCGNPTDGFSARLLHAAGLTVLADKVSAGCELDLIDALALSQTSLPLLGKLVQLRPMADDNQEREPPTGFPVDRVDAVPENPQLIGQPLDDWEPFCRRLVGLRDELPSALSAGDIAWYPALEKPLDREDSAAGGFTGMEVLRAIAIARLLLPDEVEIRAPLVALGPKLAQVALDFGASHLGFVAMDSDSPRGPLVADPSELEELLGDCSPTTVKDV